MAVRAHLLKIDGRVLGACSLACLCRCCLGGDGARAFLHLDGRVQGGMQFGVLVLMVLWDAVCGEDAVVGAV